MTAFNNDYNNTELLDQELTIEQLEAVAGGVDVIEGEDDSWWYKRMGGGGNSFCTELETGCGPDPDVSEVGYWWFRKSPNRAPPRAGFFNGFGVCTSAAYWDLTHSPEIH